MAKAIYSLYIKCILFPSIYVLHANKKKTFAPEFKNVLLSESTSAREFNYSAISIYSAKQKYNVLYIC
jgi:hypothetical protein